MKATEVDFKEIDELLEDAGYDVQSVEKIYEIVLSQIDAAPPDQRQGLYIQFVDLCHRRAARTKQVLEAHIAAAKSAHKS